MHKRSFFGVSKIVNFLFWLLFWCERLVPQNPRTCSFPHAHDGRLAAIHAGGLPAARAVRRRGRRYAAYTRHALWLPPAAALRAGVPVQQRTAPSRFLEVFFPRGLVVWRRAGTWCRKRTRRTRIFIHKQQRCPLSSPLGLRTLHPLHPKPPMSVPCFAYERAFSALPTSVTCVAGTATRASACRQRT